MIPIKNTISPNQTESLPFDSHTLIVQDFLSGRCSLSGQALMDLLAMDTDLKDLFLLSAGVGEGYSIGQHTRMVVDSFEKELMDRPETQEILSNAGITSAQFMLFLALHDIGKGRAVQEHPQADDTRKALELQYSRDILSAFCKKVGLENCIPLFLALLNDDAIGEICKNPNPSTEMVMKAAHEIRESAEQCGRFIEEFLPLKQLFHMTDAASYSFVREKFFVTDKEQTTSLNGRNFPRLVGHTLTNQNKLARLSHCLRCSELPLPSPYTPPSKDSDTLEAIFARSAFSFSLDEIHGFEKCQREIKHEQGNTSPLYSDFKKSLQAIKMERLPFRSYLLWKKNLGRRPSKQERQMRKGELRISASLPPHIQQNLRILEKIRFLHGSNSAALMMMLLSGNPSLRNTGALLHNGIAPMCGELGDGITPNGVNIGSISAETIRDVPRVVDYAFTGHGHSFNPAKFEKYLDLFQPLRSLGPAEWAQLVVSLMHFRRENPKACAEFLNFASPKTQAFIEILGTSKVQLAKQTKRMVEEYQKLEKECNLKIVVSSDDKDILGKIANYERRGKFYVKQLQELEEKIVKNVQTVHLLDSFHRALANGVILRAYTTDDLAPYEKPGTHIDLHVAEYISAFIEHDRAKMPHWMNVTQNPYLVQTEERNWNHHSVDLLQFKQWDPAGFERWHSAYAALFLEAVDIERARQRRPLEQLSALMDAHFTEEEKVIIRERMEGKSSGNTPLPEGLRGIFASLSEIPPLRSGPSDFRNVLETLAYSRKEGFFEGPFAWKHMIAALLKEKTEPGAKVRTYGYNKVKIEQELRRIEQGRAAIAKALATTQPVVEIPQDEKIRSLFTRPIPLIFASTCVVPVFGNDEYNVSRPVPLGKDGVDLIFTDSKESKRTIKALLPDDLRKQIKIDLIAKLDGGGLRLRDKY